MSRILIATCDRALASRLMLALEDAGHRTDHAVDGETALILARASGFDRIVLGQDLPLLDGSEILAQIRSEGVSTPAIVLGAGNDPTRDLRRGDSSTRHLAPPFRVTDLLDLVRLP